jgi:hypothetical protein
MRTFGGEKKKSGCRKTLFALGIRLFLIQLQINTHKIIARVIAALFSQLKSEVENILAKAAALRMNLNISESDYYRSRHGSHPVSVFHFRP